MMLLRRAHRPLAMYIRFLFRILKFLRKAISGQALPRSAAFRRAV